MKKILTVFLSLCLLASLATCFAFSASAEETDIEVTVGQAFEWNDQSADTKAQVAWIKGGGKSPDGLWQYQFYAVNGKIYSPMKFTTSGTQYAWNTKPGDDDNGLGYCRVRNYGKNFHPGYAADAVKVFTCPSGGTIQISSTVARNSELVANGTATGTSFAIYVEDRLVYPEEGNGEYLPLSSTTPQTIDVTVDVAKNERVRIHIGAIGEHSYDGVDMSNTITYKSVNDNEGEQVSDNTIPDNRISYTGDKPTIPNDNDNDNGGDKNLPTPNDGLSTGAIVGIVVAVVAVVGIAVAVVVILKKKKQE